MHALVVVHCGLLLGCGRRSGRVAEPAEELVVRCMCVCVVHTSRSEEGAWNIKNVDPPPRLYTVYLVVHPSPHQLPYQPTTDHHVS